MIHQEDAIAIIHQIIVQNCWNITLNACSNHHPTRRDFYTNAKLSLGFDNPIFEETIDHCIKLSVLNGCKLLLTTSLFMMIYSKYERSFEF